MKRSILKRHYSDVLMELCESYQLSEVKVADLVGASGMSRQTFYNHFSKLDDLVCLTASRATIESSFSPFDPRGLADACQFAIAHRGFFSQLPSYDECGYHERFLKWITKRAYDVFVPELLPLETSIERAVQIRLFCSGAYDVFSAWSKGGFKVPVENLSHAAANMMPAFMLHEKDVDFVPGDIDNYTI